MSEEAEEAETALMAALSRSDKVIVRTIHDVLALSPATKLLAVKAVSHLANVQQLGIEQAASIYLAHLALEHRCVVYQVA